MNIRIECEVEGHKGEWVEYRPLRLKDRRQVDESKTDVETWEAIKTCFLKWNLTDADGNPLPAPCDLAFLDLDEMEDALFVWLIGAFWDAIRAGRRRALSSPFSKQSDSQQKEKEDSPTK